MILTILMFAVFLVAVTGSAILLFQLFKDREDPIKRKIALPPPPLPTMVGLSKTIEDAAADQAAREIALDLDRDLYGLHEAKVTTKDGLDAMIGYYDIKRNSDDDWSTVFPEKPKKKRKVRAKKKPTRVRRPKRG